VVVSFASLPMMGGIFSHLEPWLATETSLGKWHISNQRASRRLNLSFLAAKNFPLDLTTAGTGAGGWGSGLPSQPSPSCRTEEGCPWAQLSSTRSEQPGQPTGMSQWGVLVLATQFWGVLCYAAKANWYTHILFIFITFDLSTQPQRHSKVSMRGSENLASSIYTFFLAQELQLWSWCPMISTMRTEVMPLFQDSKTKRNKYLMVLPGSASTIQVQCRLLS
jgi:hypothetical protein